MAQAYFDARRALGFPMAADDIRQEVEAQLQQQDDKAAQKQKGGK